MEERRLPVGWEACQLGDVIEYGKTIKAEPETIGDDAWVLELEDIEKDTSRLLQKVCFSERKSKSTKNTFRAGDVLYGKLRPYLNKVLLADTPGYCSTEIVPLTPGELLAGEYLFYWLKSPVFLEYTSEVSHGINMPRLGTEAGRKAPFVLAPLNEQRCIAVKLDTTLAAVDACRQRLDGVEALLKRFRQAVLAAATSGELTREWREERGIDKNWEDGLLAELMKGKPRNGYSPMPADRETAVKSLTLSATTTGRFLPHHFKYIGEAIPSDSYLWLEPGDILIQRANTLEYVGVSAIYEGSSGEFIYPDLMMKCQANHRAEPRFLCYLLSTERTRNYFRSNATGTSGNMPKINQQVVMAAPVAWPSRVEQQEIIRRAQQLFSLADQLEARLTTARNTVERLTPALLAKAFRGELVSQDPNDEPASELLARIRAARQADPAAGKASRRGRKKAAAIPEMSLIDAATGPPDQLGTLLRECGALSRKALLAASELEPRRFEAQLALEHQSRHIQPTWEDGEELWEAVG